MNALRTLLVDFFSRFHSVCMLLLPGDLRARYGGALRDTARDALREASRRGLGNLILTAWAECFDVARQRRAARRRPATERPTSALDGLALDLRVGVRGLAQRHSLSVMLTLAVGIGATTAVFGVVDAVLLRDLPYPAAERLIRVGSMRPRSTSVAALSPPLLEALYERAESLESIAASSSSWVTASGTARPERIRAAWVSGEFFPMLGADQVAGRLLGTSDDNRDAPPAAVLGHEFWQRRYGGSTAVLGQTITLSNRVYLVTGVLARNFVPPEGNRLRGTFDVWLPLAHFELMNEPGLVFLDAFARLAPGTPSSVAAAELDALGRSLAVELELPERAFTTLRTAPLRQETVGDIGTTLWTLMAAVSLLLAIACANVANLMLTRAAERQHEVSLRVALGAGGGQLARMLLLESTLLAIAGGAVGTAIAYLAVAALRAFEPANIPRLAEIGVDIRVLLFTLATTSALGAVTGLLPALRARYADPARALGATPAMSTGRGQGMLARTLVTTQTALALMLVIAAALLVHSFVRLARVDVGFDGANLMRLQVGLGSVLDGSEQVQHERIAFFEELRRRVAEIPGVRDTHLTTGAPFSPGGWYSSINVVGRVEGEVGGPGAEESASRHQVSSDHLTSLGLHVLRGREINDDDSAESLPVVVINETLARRYWPDGDALGTQVTIGGDGSFTPRTVVGIVSDARYHELEEAPGLHLYLPFEQFPAIAMDVMARFDGEPAIIAEAMREAVWSLRADLAIRDISTMRELVYADLVEPGFYTWLLGSFAVAALLLAGVGIYGSMAHATTLRTREIGIRIAIGAQPAETVRMVLRGALATTALGTGIGLAGAWATTRYLSGFLYEIEVTDAGAWIAASAFFLLLALLAAYVPARRAARIDPIEALRCE